MDIGVLRTGKVARLLSVKPHRINYRIRDLQIAPKTRGMDGNYLWTYREVCELASLLEVAKPTRAEFCELASLLEVAKPTRAEFSALRKEL